MSGKNKKKIGYKQYAALLAQAHQKLDILAERYQELQTYFIAYVEYRGDNIEFNDWMNKRITAMKAEIQEKEKEHANEEV
jgi:hypothetical protein|tara:strand:+ start:342 stop:581 length:240 start_codon:yes stop_codon:yes gene_type:complete